MYKRQHSESTNFQYIPLTPGTGYLVAKLVPTGTINGNLTMPESADMKPFLDTSWRVVSQKSRVYGRGGPESFGWTEFKLDESGKFTVPNLSVGIFSILPVKEIQLPFRDGSGYTQSTLSVENTPLQHELKYICLLYTSPSPRD